MTRTHSTNPPAEVSMVRRHDFDALRASAMLLGIAYHIALSFVAGFPWLVQDDYHHGGFKLFQYAVHGFRMPVFFLISGFFTAMLWRKRGVKALVKHRFRRILLPCLLGLLTVVPVTFVVSALALQSGMKDTSKPGALPAANSDIWTAVTRGDASRVRELIEQGANVNQRHPALGVLPLTLATLASQPEVVKVMLDHGADVNGRNLDGATALHAAAFFGRSEIAGLLIEIGADVRVRNPRGETAAEVAHADWKVTQMVAGLLQVPVNEQEVMQGRERVLELLRAQASAPAASADPERAAQEDGSSRAGALLRALKLIPIFCHLWFLWFLWWLVLGFSLLFLVADRFGWRGAPGWLVLSPARLLWLVPLTMLPQAAMGATNIGFGPDTSIGLLPMPHVFFYYALFFGFGILYHDADDTAGRVGGGWCWSLPVTLLVVFPLGLEVCTGTFGFRGRLPLGDLERPLAVGLQALYAWLMTFGGMGLFRSLLKHENRTVRWLSDSSYWLYVAHLPLVILAQLWVRDWPLAATLKFLLLNALILAFLLATYQWMVRYTWVGRLLNGPRTRPVKTPTTESPPTDAVPLAQS